MIRAFDPTFPLSPSVQINGIKTKSVPVSILLPHEVLHALAGCNAGVCFESLMLGNLSPSAIANFWKHVRGLEPWRQHPILTDPSQDLSKIIGVQLHADGAEFYRDDEVYVFSWSSVFASQGMDQDVMLYRFPLMIVAERHMQVPSVPRPNMKAFRSSCEPVMFLEHPCSAHSRFETKKERKLQRFKVKAFASQVCFENPSCA